MDQSIFSSVGKSKMFSISSNDILSAQQVSLALDTIKLACMDGSKFDEKSHEDWRISSIRNPITVTVSEPETRGSYLTKYTTYLVRQEPQNHKVRRRFSDFEWIHNTLANRYIGMIIPSLPEKNAYKTESFLKSRMRGLNLFIQSVIDQPYFRFDDSVTAFLSIQDDREWENAKKQTQNLDNAGEGHLRWMKALYYTIPPKNAERIIMDVKRQLEHLEKSLSLSVSSSKRLAEKSLSMSKEVSEFCSMFGQWSSHEISCADASKVEFVIDGSGELVRTMTDTAKLLKSWSEIIQFQPSIHEFLLHENLKFLYSQVKDLQTLIKSRDIAIQNYEKSLKAWKIHENERDLAINKGLSGKISKLDYSLADDEAHTSRLQFIVDYYTRALFFSELQRFHDIRTQCLKETIGPLVTAEYQFTKRMGNTWKSFIQSSQMDSQEMMKKAKDVLEAAGTAESTPSMD